MSTNKLSLSDYDCDSSTSTAINGGGGLIKCPRNTAPNILANILKLFPSSSLNTTIIGTTFSYVITAFDGNFSFSCAHPTTQILSLGWTMLFWIKINKRGGYDKNVMVYICSKKN